MKGLTNRNILDKLDSLELTLELNSFAGGENLIGGDQDLKLNEARIIQNWDVDSLQGMKRAKGFTKIGEGSNTIETEVFTGSGLDDATKGGTYTGTVTATYTVIIDSTGTPDTFKWKKNSGSFTTGVVITGSAQTLSDGVTITFSATTGHTANDQWVITAISYANASDLIIQHFEGVNNEVYGIIEGDLVILDTANIVQEDANAFTSGILSHGVSAGSKLWITNSTDGLRYKTIGNPLATPTTQPPTNSERISEMNFRLIAEGNSSKKVYGSVVGSGNWANAGGWTTSNNAWSMTMPDLTKGHIPGWPSGTDLTVFTEFDTWVIYNQPGVARRRIINGIGSSAPYALAKGSEGVFIVSKYPTLGVFIWDGVNFTNLTEYHDFVNDINFSQRIFGIYRDRKYYLFYNEIGSGVTYPNKAKIYNTRFGRWMSRPLNTSLSEALGYPCLLTKTNNELYVASSITDKWYDFEDSSTSDNGQETRANFKTKVITSRDFLVSTGANFPLDNVRLKLVKATATMKGVNGVITNGWTVDRGKRSGQQVFSLTAAEGDLLNDTFEVNTSDIISFDDLVDKRETRSFNNTAVGREFEFQILTNGTGIRTELKNLKITAVVLEDL